VNDFDDAEVMRNVRWTINRHSEDLKKLNAAIVDLRKTMRQIKTDIKLIDQKVEGLHEMMSANQLGRLFQ